MASILSNQEGPEDGRYTLTRSLALAPITSRKVVVVVVLGASTSLSATPEKEVSLPTLPWLLLHRLPACGNP